MEIHNVPGPSEQAELLIDTQQKVRSVESGIFCTVNPLDAYSLCSYRSCICYWVCHWCVWYL